ncbi:PIN domain-containing protein [Nanoarchaeota archaeon]
MFNPNSRYIKIIKTNNEDYDFARKFEKEDEFKLSFYDYLHIALSKRLDAPLVTRDKELIEIGSKIIPVIKPEDLPT